MYQKPTSTDTAKKLPIVQDACLLFSFDLGQEQSIAVEAGKKRFWSNSGDQTLEILVMKSREQT